MDFRFVFLGIQIGKKVSDMAGYSIPCSPIVVVMRNGKPENEVSIKCGIREMRNAKIVKIKAKSIKKRIPGIPIPNEFRIRNSEFGIQGIPEFRIPPN